MDRVHEVGPVRKDAVRFVIAVQGQADLLQIVDALRTGGPPRGRPAPPGKSKAMRTPMIVMTTSNSTRVKPLGRRIRIFRSLIERPPFRRG